MAIALVSPVGMKAVNGTVKVVLSDLDTATGASLKNSSLSLDEIETVGDAAENATTVSGIVDAFLEFEEGSHAAAYTGITISVYDGNDGDSLVASWTQGTKNSVTHSTWNRSGGMSSVELEDGYWIYIELLVDTEAAGYTLGSGVSDDIDDREQIVITVKFQTEPGSTTYYQAVQQYVVNPGDNVHANIINGEYTEEFPGWSTTQTFTVNGVTNTYAYVYSSSLTSVTSHTTVYANWAVNVTGLERFETSTTGTDTEECPSGQEWNADEAKCLPVVNTEDTVTIPDTATK